MNSAKNDIQLSAVEDHGGILTIRGGGARRDWNGIHYKQGMSGKNVGTTRLSANIATIPPCGGTEEVKAHVRLTARTTDRNQVRKRERRSQDRQNNDQKTG